MILAWASPFKQIKSLLLEMKCVFQHQHMYFVFCSQIKQNCILFQPLKVVGRGQFAEAYT